MRGSVRVNNVGSPIIVNSIGKSTTSQIAARSARTIICISITCVAIWLRFIYFAFDRFHIIGYMTHSSIINLSKVQYIENVRATTPN
jgi:hypothetical protein